MNSFSSDGDNLHYNSWTWNTFMSPLGTRGCFLFLDPMLLLSFFFLKKKALIEGNKHGIVESSNHATPQHYRNKYTTAKDTIFLPS
jgi:hypothetical protein